MTGLQAVIPKPMLAASAVLITVHHQPTQPSVHHVDVQNEEVQAGSTCNAIKNQLFVFK